MKRQKEKRQKVKTIKERRKKEKILKRKRGEDNLEIFNETTTKRLCLNIKCMVELEVLTLP